MVGNSLSTSYVQPHPRREVDLTYSTDHVMSDDDNISCSVSVCVFVRAWYILLVIL